MKMRLSSVERPLYFPELQMTFGGPQEEVNGRILFCLYPFDVDICLQSPYGQPVEPAKAPEAIGRAVASLPPEQMFELMKQMKVSQSFDLLRLRPGQMPNFRFQLCIQTNPNEARNMLLQNPQLAYALLQAQVVMRIVDPQMAMTMLHRETEPVAPVMPQVRGSILETNMALESSSFRE